MNICLAQDATPTSQPDSINISAVIDSSTYESPIDAIITYPARDSTVYDIAKQTVYMYGDAKVTYKDITLEADYIEYDFSRLEVVAFGSRDTSDNVVGKPKFSQGGTSFGSDTIHYNFETEKGIIYNVKTQEGDSYVHAEKSKKQADGEIHNKGGKYTTCSLDNPHYHFQFNKMVVIPNDKIVTGPVYMKVRKVPVPLALPFGFFPNSDKRKAGIIIPGYGQNDDLGFFLINGGYYLPLGERMDTKLTADVYSRGSWGLRDITRYISRYKYSGNVDISFNKRLGGDSELNDFTKSTSFFVRWNHQQDSKARPGTSFSASVNAGSSNNFRNNYNSSLNDYISNVFNSRINLSRRWSSSQLTLSGSHDQNTANRSVNFTLPSVGFNVNRFFLPLSFLRGSATGGQRWYETIGVTYRTNFINRLSTSEPELRLGRLDRLTSQFSNGISHNLGVRTSIKAGYFTINPSFSMTERWHFARQQQRIEGGELVTDTLDGFFATRDGNLSINATTKVYGMFQFKGNRIKAIRHVMTPSVGLAFSPEFDYQEEYLQDGELEQYNPYTVSAYRQTGFAQKRAAVTFGLQNNLEAKVRDRKDSTSVRATKKVSIIDNFSLNTSYNMIADSLKLANISISARTSPVKGINLQYSGSYSPYQFNSSSRAIDRWSFQNGGPLLRARNHTLSVNTQLSGGSKNKKTNTSPETSTFSNTEEIERGASPRFGFSDFSAPWNIGMTYTYRQTNTFTATDTSIDREGVQSQNVLFNGDVRLMKKWRIGISTGYDLEAGERTSTQIDLNWDLHCWEFDISYIPDGNRKSYNAFLGVKAPILSDLKLRRRGRLGEPLLN